MKKLLIVLLIGLVAGCTAQQDNIAIVPTSTFLPIPSQQPRYTATPESTRTPLPTFTYTPTETPIPPTITNTTIPTATPTITGIVQSLQRVNVRQGPGVDFSELEALAPGTGVQVIGQNEEGSWFNVRLEDGREGWIASSLLFIPPTATAFPTATASPDLNALLNNPLPTAILGGGTVTPTPPSVIATATPVGQQPTTSAPITPSATQPLVPIVSSVPNVNLDTIKLTATALASGAATPTPSFTPVAGATARILTVAPSGTDSGTNILTASAPTAESVSATTVPGENSDGVDVFAYCDDPAFGIPAPVTIRAGQAIDIWWAWFAKEEQQVRDHIANAEYDLRVNGQPLTDINNYVTAIRRSGSDYAAYWYIPYIPTAAGTYEITYAVSWKTAITDGYEFFGPGTNKPFEQHTCKFNVR